VNRQQNSNFTFCKGGLTLCIGESMGTNAVLSMRQAYRMAESRRFGRVMFLNTFQSNWKLEETGRRSIDKHFSIKGYDGPMTIACSTIGEMANKRHDIIPFFDAADPVKVVIINSWEFAARDSRLRERLLFFINEWITRYDVSVIIYAQTNKRQTEAGTIDRAGFGKLAGIANEIMNVVDDEKDGLKADDSKREVIKQKEPSHHSGPSAQAPVTMESPYNNTEVGPTLEEFMSQYPKSVEMEEEKNSVHTDDARI